MSTWPKNGSPAIICVKVVKDFFALNKYRTVILLNLKNTFEVDVPRRGVCEG